MRRGLNMYRRRGYLRRGLKTEHTQKVEYINVDCRLAPVRSMARIHGLLTMDGEALCVLPDVLCY